MNQTTNQTKIWIDKDSEFYYRSMKSWLQNNDTEMYSRYNKEKSIVARTLKNKFINIWLEYQKYVY